MGTRTTFTDFVVTTDRYAVASECCGWLCKRYAPAFPSGEGGPPKAVDEVISRPAVSAKHRSRRNVSHAPFSEGVVSEQWSENAGFVGAIHESPREMSGGNVPEGRRDAGIPPCNKGKKIPTPYFCVGKNKVDSADCFCYTVTRGARLAATGTAHPSQDLYSVEMAVPIACGGGHFYVNALLFYHNGNNADNDVGQQIQKHKNFRKCHTPHLPTEMW